MSAVLLAMTVAIGCGSRATTVLEAPSLMADERTVSYEHGGVLMALKNGMRLLVLPDDGTNVVEVDMRYTVGASDDPAGRAGLAHLVEHLTYLAKLPPATATIDEQLGDFVLYRNAETRWDRTQYMASGLSEHLSQLMTLEAQRLRVGCEHIDESLLQREREVVRNEIRQRDSAGRQLLRRVLADTYGSAHPYGKDVGGDDNSLAAITRDDVCDFLARHYRPDNAIMVLSGAVDLNQAKRLFGRLFSKVKNPDGASVPRPVPPAPTLRGTDSEHALPVTEATAVIVYNAPALAASRGAFERIARHLVERRLWTVRKELRAITSLQLFEVGGQQAPLLAIAVSVNQRDQLRPAVAAVQKSLTGLLRDVDTDALGNIKEQVRAGFLRSIESFADEADLFLDYLQYTDHQQYAIAELQQYDRMTRASLSSYLDARFPAQASHVTYALPAADQSAISTRAALAFAANDHDIPDWRARVNIAQADQDLPLPNNRLRPAVREFQLGNGLRVLLVPELGHPVVDIRLLFRGGSLHEPAEHPGLASWAAQLMQPDWSVQWRASVDPSIVVQLMRAMHRMGASYETSVSETATTFRTTGLSMYADGLLWQLYALVRTGHYDGKTLGLVREQLGRQATSDTQTRREVLLARLYGDKHRYGRFQDPKEQLAKIDIAALSRFRDAHYHASGATLIVTGEFDVPFIEAQVRNLFGTLGKREPPATPRVEPPVGSDRPTYLAYSESGAAQLNIAMAFVTSAGTTEQLAQRLVLDELLTLEFGALREQLGSSYGVQVTRGRREGPGHLLISADVDSARAVESYRALAAALQRIRTGAVQASFVRARRTALRQLLESSVNSATVASELELTVAHDLKRDFFADVARSVARMRLDDLQPVIATDLDAAGSVTLLSGQRSVIDAVYGSIGVSSVTVSSE